MIRLEIPNTSHQEAYDAMIALWRSHESIPTSPSTLFAGDSYSDFLRIRESYQTNPPPGKVRASLFFVMRDKAIIGAVDIRHEIASSEYLTNF